MKEKIESKEHTSFKIYSTLATIFIVTVFAISLLANDEASEVNSSNTKLTASKESSTKINNEANKAETQDTTKMLEVQKITNDTQTKEREISYSYPVKGDIIIKFSPNELIYDEILEQYRTSNGITMKTYSKDLNAMCDSKIISIEKNNSSKSEIKLMTTDNHIITLSGYFSNFSKKEGDVILKGSKLCNINNINETSYIDINISLDNKFIDPIKLINS